MSRFAAFPARPPAIAEWEDLLVRYEIGPRALRVALADAPPEAASSPRVLDALRALVANEAWTDAVLAAMRERRPLEAHHPQIDMLPPDADAMVERYERLRGRNFAAAQRRGLEVWDWSADLPDGETVTAYQLLNAGAAMDGEMLAEVREALRGAGAC